MKRIAIIGGGISGLSAAYYLEKQRQAGAEMEYVLFERASKLGGVLRTDRVEGCLLEAGPDSFLTEKPWALTLCRELGLGDQIIGSNDAQRRTFILVNNKLVEMPDGLMFMVPTRILPTVFTSLFSLGTKLRMARELFHPPRPAAGDESVAALVERHFGTEVVDRLADPLLSGIYGADSSNLSVRTVLPRFIEMEAKYGSLCRGMLAARKKMAQMTQGKPKPPLFSSLKEGMQQLVDTLLQRIGTRTVRTDCEIADVRLSGETWQVSVAPGSRPAGSLASQTENFDAVIFATPGHVAGGLLQSGHPELGAELGGISYSSSVTVNLVYDRRDLAGHDLGFGFLVPRSERRRMLACTFVHNKFPHRAPDDRGIVRTFLGGLRDQSAVTMSDDEILRTVQQELREITGISAEPRAARVYRWNRAMSQPAPGHLDRIARIEWWQQRLPGLGLAGNYFRGIGVPDCVRTGMEAAERVGAASAVAATK